MSCLLTPSLTGRAQFVGDEGKAVVQKAESFVFGLALAGQINGLLAQATVELNHVGTQNGRFLEVCHHKFLLGVVAENPLSPFDFYHDYSKSAIKTFLVSVCK